MELNKNVKIYVAMSGGVDSSVSAALLKKGLCPELGRRVNVVGVYMKQWSPKILGKECIWKQDRQDAMAVCAKLGILFETWDFSREYEKYVGKYMVDSYKKGITPNPDVACNKVIKFGLFYDKAMKCGADFVATGHYAQTMLGLANQIFSAGRASLRGTLSSKKFIGSTSLKKNFPSRSFCYIPPKLFKATDKNKDQTYFLYDIKKEKLNKIIFPVGDLTKPEVRKLAKKFGLQNAQKKDSQGVCFVGQFDMKNFLKQYIKPKKGKIASLSGEVLGEHDGVYYYTIGQRHGLDIKNGKGPYFVIKKNIKKNIIYVGKEKDLYSKNCKVAKINWLQKPEKFPFLVEARTRYRAPLAKAVIYKNGKLVFKKPERALTPGQSAVFYKNQTVLGGGTIV